MFRFVVVDFLICSSLFNTIMILQVHLKEMCLDLGAKV